MSFRRYLPRLLSGQNRLLLLVLLLTLLCVFLGPVNLQKRAPTYQATFDISQSMYVEDAGPDGRKRSRLQLSKDAALHLLRELPCGSQLGWAVFSGSRVINLITPLEVCEHYDGLVSSLSAINGNMRWTNSSSIGKGLHQSMRSASEMSPDTGVLFFSDGHEAPPLGTGERGMPASSKYKIDGIIVGVGGLQPTPIPKYDAEGRFIGYWSPGDVVQQIDAASGSSHEELSELREAHLRELARLTEMPFTHLKSVNSLGNAIDKAGHGSVRSVATDLRWIPAGLALLLLCWVYRPAFLLRN